MPRPQLDLRHPVATPRGSDAQSLVRAAMRSHEHAPMLVSIVDVADLRMRVIDIRFARLLGHAPAQLAELQRRFFSHLLHPTERERAQSMQSFWATASDDEEFEFEYRLRHEDGTFRRFWTCLRVIERDESGRVRSLIGASLPLDTLPGRFGAPRSGPRGPHPGLHLVPDAHTVGPPVRPPLVDVDGRGFRLANGCLVLMGRRGPARRILSTLARSRAEHPGQSVAIGALFQAGWPGVVLDEPHHSNRVYTAIATLRKLGMGDLVVHDGDGYQLDGRLPIEIAVISG